MAMKKTVHRATKRSRTAVKRRVTKKPAAKKAVKKTVRTGPKKR